MFSEYGLTIYTGRRGNGKLASMVNYLDRMHKKYPKALIVTDFEYKYATHSFKNMRDILDISNGQDGVIFATDDYPYLFCNKEYEYFPEWLLCAIMQQRRLHIKIVATCLDYSYIPKRLRPLCFTVVYCERLFSRFLIASEYDALDYENRATKKIRPLRSRLILPKLTSETETTVTQ